MTNIYHVIMGSIHIVLDGLLMRGKISLPSPPFLYCMFIPVRLWSIFKTKYASKLKISEFLKLSFMMLGKS